MKFVSWNVNGLRACLKKGFEETFRTLDADFFCIQETKMQPGQADFAPESYTEYIYSADKKGYSGTAIWARTPALSVHYGLEEDIHNHEGRAITLEYPDFYLVNLYVPNSQNELARIDYRMRWEDDLRRYLQKLDAQKPVILCGDLNVAHTEIDLKNPGPNRGAAGFSDEERGKLDELLAAGFTDSFWGLFARRLPPPAPRRHRHVQLVEHAVPRPGAQRRMAHRLFPGEQPPGPPDPPGRDPDGDPGQRPLPGHPGLGCIKRHRTHI